MKALQPQEKAAKQLGLSLNAGEQKTASKVQ